MRVTRAFMMVIAANGVHMDTYEMAQYLLQPVVETANYTMKVGFNLVSNQCNGDPCRISKTLQVLFSCFPQYAWTYMDYRALHDEMSFLPRKKDRLFIWCLEFTRMVFQKQKSFA